MSIFDRTFSLKNSSVEVGSLYETRKCKQNLAEYGKQNLV